MADLIGPLTTELRITGRIIRETFLGIKRTGWMNVVLVVTMASILSIFGILMVLVLDIGHFLKGVGTEVEISAYIQDGVDARVVRDQVASVPHVRKITVISKEKAWADMQSQYPLAEIENPLPDTLHIQVDDEANLPKTVDALKQVPQLVEVQYPRKVLEKIRAISQSASLVGSVAIVFFGTLTLFIISNTIHLLIQGKSREIEILRMMGVGNWYIRLPFLMQGASYGLIGALISYIPLSYAIYHVNQFFDFMTISTPTITSEMILLLLMAMGVLVGASGSAMAVRKYLHI